MTGPSEPRAPLSRDRLTPDSRHDGAAGPVRPGRAPQGPRRPRFRVVRRFAGAALAGVVLVGAVGTLVVWQKYEALVADLPTVDGLQHYQPPVMSRIYSSDSRVLSELASERRIFVPYTAIPGRVAQAFVSAEDQNFWTHAGVDPLAILRAAVTDLEAMGSHHRPIGASTITQQVARIMLLGTNSVSLERKAKEAVLAMRIEQTLSKQRILEIYLNEIYLGAGAYGIVAAAQAYFNKPLDQLTVAEAAFLGALPKSPTNYNPYRFPDAAKARRDWVIDRMAETGAITRAEARAAQAEPLIPRDFHRPAPIPGADWFAEEVRRQLVTRYGQAETNEGGLVVQTSLDPKLQAEATRDLRQGLIDYDRTHEGWHGTVAHLDNVTGDSASWAAPLAQVTAPGGMLTSWRLAVLLPESLQQAPGRHRAARVAASGRVGWLERESGAPHDAGTAHVGVLSAADQRWMRNAHAGDVVMVEPAAKDADAKAQAAKGVAATEPGTEGAEAPDSVLLREVPKVEGAVVTLDPHTGRVLALVGGWSFEASQFNRATQAQRQPGSSFKPIVYLAAMEQGLSPSQQFMDAPFVQGSWRPNNYEMTFNGPTSLHDALKESLNLVTVRLAAHIGMDAVAKLAIGLHEVDSMPKVLPAALGAVETTVLREAGAYAAIEEGGREVVPSLIDSVQNRDGRVIYRAPGLALANADSPDQPPELDDTRAQVADPASSYQVVTMMRDVIKRGTGQPAGIGIDRPLAGKTGTSQDFNDAWFVGFSPNLLTAVWVGYDNPSSLGDKETGGRIAAPIWNKVMRVGLDGTPPSDFRQPPGVFLANWSSGQGQALDAFKDGQQPGQSVGLGGVSLTASDDALGAGDTGAETAPPPTAPLGMPGTPGEPGAPGASAGPPPGPPQTAHAPSGGDIGMGGLY